MSSAVFSTSAAQGRPFIFDEENVAEIRPQPTGAELFPETPRPSQKAVPRISRAFPTALNDARLASVTPASRLAIRPAPEMVSSGIPALDALTGGLPRGSLTEIFGPASSGRTTVLLSALAAATQRGEFCAVVDASDALDPMSIAAAEVNLDRLLWIRCEDTAQPYHALEQVLRATDLLLESGGFGMIALDLGDIPPQTARRIPLATWFRFRRAVEHTPTVLLAIERQSIAGSCSSLLIKMKSLKLPGGGAPLLASFAGSGNSNHPSTFQSQSQPTHAQLLTQLEISAELVRSRLERKPVRSAEIAFESRTAWA
jgi:recA bacterial DNA recombination protein